MTEKYVIANFVRILLTNLSFLTLSSDIVPDPPFSHDMLRLGRLFLKLLAKPADMYVHRPDIALVFIPPYNI